MKINRLKADLAKAKEKATEWQAKIKDLERQITEQENLEILQTVRGVAASPEEIRDILDLIRTAQKPLKTAAYIKEEQTHEE